MKLRSFLILSALCFVPFRADTQEPSRHTPSLEDVVAAQNELRECAESSVHRKPTIEAETRLKHATAKFAALLKAGIADSSFVEAYMGELAGDLALSEEENFKVIDEFPLLNLQRLLRDQTKVANQLAIIQTFQQQRIIEQNDRLIHLLEQTPPHK